MRYKDFITTELHDDIEKDMAYIVEKEFSLSNRLKTYMKDLSRKEVLK